MKILYLSHTGMTEPLGQAQVLPYVRGAARNGAEIEIVSFEPAQTSPATVQQLLAELGHDGIRWRPLLRSPSHAIGRKLVEAAGALLEAIRASRSAPDIIHARSYLPAGVADALTMLWPRARYVFDCRGMMADEYVDAGHWTKDMVQYRLVKLFERRFFRRAAGIVVLTDALRRWLADRRMLRAGAVTQVIPCCVDTGRFRPAPATRSRVRHALGVDDRLVVVYSGTLGSWYLEREMARFVATLNQVRGDVTWLVLTRAPTDRLEAAARAEGLDESQIIIRPVTPSEMPDFLAAGDLGISFIAPCFSKLGSSPTKVAEYLAAGMPVVVNEGVGDQARLAAHGDACITLRDFSSGELKTAVERSDVLARQSYENRSACSFEVAESCFSLANIGIPRYAELYRAICA